MIFFPAIDLKDGRCVRLLRGEMATAVVFNETPGAQATAFAEAGCSWLHVVDLDGAFAGRPVNAAAVEAIVSSSALKVQLGGGIRTMDTVRQWLERGVHRVILGTAAVQDPAFVETACRTYPGRIAIGIDARDGRVAVSGWAQVTELAAIEVARRFEAVAPAAIIYTDIGRDGAMTGPNIEATVALARAVSTPVIASGGVSAMDDLERLMRHSEDLLEGVICGRAVYEGRIEPGAAVALLAGEERAAPC